MPTVLARSPSLLPEDAKFKTRYATLGFNDDANLDEGAMRLTAFALEGV